MTHAIESLAGHLPHLRRFARALAGTQKAGDAYVIATLEAMANDPMIVPENMDARVALFKVFIQIWNSISLNSSIEAEAETKAPTLEQRIQALSPLPRQAFLLTALEQFSVGDSAIILQMDSNVVQQSLEEAINGLSAQAGARVLIIEDEPLIALDLRKIIHSLGHKALEIARTREDAVHRAQEEHPDLILADIRLADGSSGIDAVQEIHTSIDVPVIYITAHPELLLTGEKPEPTYLLSKPYQPDAVKALISQALLVDTQIRR